MRTDLRGIRWALLALGLLVVASLLLGSRPLAVIDVGEAFFRDNGDPRTIVVDQRIPRTVLALLVGLSLGLAGALMQGMTRNPLADPGLLGVGAGAAFAIALGALLVPGASSGTTVWFAFAGAGLTTLVVYVIGNLGGRGRSPATLVLTGMAVGAVLAGLTQLIVLFEQRAFSAARSFGAGSLEGTDWTLVRQVAPFLVVGVVLAAFAARGLNALALGDDVAAALGVHPWLVRALVVVGVTVLCGAATAAAGVIWFVGMMVPHVARWITGPDQRRILAWSAALGALLMVAADVVGRVVVIPDEVPAGVVTALIGAPVLIGLVRRRTASAL
ncbi:iron chelate uptake ABC transporter family permease subunit [Pimelobacter simplex]|uniref:ABC-type Fe3+-siderophore transport system, permease component n=1 Tax=Nocardioides simplex TaxID=2045 RepID=A0A0A1DNM7_NOCSI|nr:iron ABC transporter permease [Pimelobacter simplex]AIY18153.1 ABC-type Fe3+-siderophore transport system, permease component [Pimelobacter simplex]MCG8153781.1 iron chelate uptake ABC transporter family permease subunit [Pimelobacter simplex]GEB15732.1 iron ABC transporter permease [Pimelobacter simplex]SFN10015.1 iron complex transport system permease protein [Pimelobacter simplex]